MANTGNTQQIINYGATANDGTGDPLRTAFIKTDENFSNIWTAGPVGSNISIANNTIQNDATNGNIVIKPNGIGVIQANASIVPSIDSARDLGTANLAWRRVYTDAMNLVDLTVSGNLTVDGDIIQIGNLVTDALTIQLANTAATDSEADGSGITVGASDDIATLLYNSTNNEWRTNIGANIAGNITGSYFIGNGSQLTGITSTYGNADVADFLANFGSNTISTTGNVVLGNISTSGKTLILASGSANATVANAAGITVDGADARFTYIAPSDIWLLNKGLFVDGNLNIDQGGNGAGWSFFNDSHTISFPSGATWTSNVTLRDEFIASAPDGYLDFSTYDTQTAQQTQFLMEHGLVRIKIFNGPNKEWDFLETGTTLVPGDIIPSSNTTASLGNSTNYWSNLWVANNTIYIGGVPLGVTGNTLTVAGEPVLSNDSNATITTTGNITADYFFGNGSQLTDVNAVTVDVTDTNGLTTIYYPTFVENRTTGQIARADVDLTYRTDDNVLTVGNVSVTGNITGNTAGFAIGYRDIPQVSFTGNATIAAADAGKHFYSTESTDYILTIADNSAVTWPVGTAITVVNRGTGNITVAQASGVSLYLAGNSSAGNRTVSTYGMVTLLNVAANVWMINGTGVA